MAGNGLAMEELILAYPAKESSTLHETSRTLTISLTL